jgi:hypothetical protein
MVLSPSAGGESALTSSVLGIDNPDGDKAGGEIALAGSVLAVNPDNPFPGSAMATCRPGNDKVESEGAKMILAQSMLVIDNADGDKTGGISVNAAVVENGLATDASDNDDRLRSLSGPTLATDTSSSEVDPQVDRNARRTAPSLADRRSLRDCRRR